MDPIGTVRVRHTCKDGISYLVSYTKVGTNEWVGFYSTLEPGPIFATTNHLPDSVATQYPLACDAEGWVG